MNPVEYAESKGWKKVDFGIKFKQELGPLEQFKGVEPREINATNFGGENAKLIKEDDGKAYFKSYMELMENHNKQYDKENEHLELEIVMINAE
ncbi:hypothetical protein MHB46_21515 [Paenibacillus sp. FSL H7-0703]|uniref:hypothetical protein n=1 Tax=Paenibacillus sp. FSL H7-0703 TaxID=2921438 RepID=UPI0030F90FF6